MVDRGDILRRKVLNKVVHQKPERRKIIKTFETPVDINFHYKKTRLLQ